MFGPAYKQEMPLEIFLRYIEPGIQKIDTIRNALSFIPNKEFAHILKTASERKLISLNLQNKTIFLSQKTNDVIRFIEKYNFIDELQRKELDNSYKFTDELDSLLSKINFYGKKYHDVAVELSNAMRLFYEEDYCSEIMNFRVYIHKNNQKSNENEVEIDFDEIKEDEDEQ